MPGPVENSARFFRIMLRVQLTGMVVGAAALVYVLGFGVHPHRVAFACVMATGYIVLSGVVTLLLQRAWRTKARRAAATAARHSDSAMTTQDAVLSAPGRRAGIRSQRRTWLSVTLLGVAMLSGFLVLVSHYESPALALASNGVRAQGVVTGVTGQGEPPANGAVDVQYGYAGQSFTTHIYRNDNSPRYRVGDAVTVTLDPSDPQIATVGGSDNMGPGMVWLLIVLLLGGGCVLVVGIAMLIATELSRRKARSAAIQAGHLA